MSGLQRVRDMSRLEMVLEQDKWHLLRNIRPLQVYIEY
jgi:hypothetical protein